MICQVVRDGRTEVCRRKHLPHPPGRVNERMLQIADSEMSEDG
jgi:hypothetical protein